ncbi:MAG: flagellar motor switch protein FliN [Gemmatimonadetes bacterium]|nr:flagellar motor switch protein FliN [Gemmatimonadota bacterium]
MADAPVHSTPADYAELAPATMPQGEVPLSAVLDLSMNVSIELGKTRMTVQDLLRLGRGSVIQLDRMRGEPVDVLVADRRFAEGEVVVIGEYFGIRITKLLAQVPSGDAAQAA